MLVLISIFCFTAGLVGGGVTYAHGALLCHALDLALIVAACATVLTALLAPPHDGPSAADGDPR